LKLKRGNSGVPFFSALRGEGYDPAQVPVLVAWNIDERRKRQRSKRLVRAGIAKKKAGPWDSDDPKLVGFRWGGERDSPEIAAS